MANTKENPERKTLTGNLTLWITVLSGAVTLVLTVINAYTSSRIQELEVKLKQNTQDMEQRKANIERYQWVFTHFEDLESEDKRKRNFATSLVRLALSEIEAKQLFNNLQNSGDTLLQSVGQNGISNINNEPIAVLVSKLDAATSTERLDAFNKLKSGYSSSTAAIDLVLNLYLHGKINSLSANGVINGLYFLGGTEAEAWSKPQAAQAKILLKDLQGAKYGAKTATAIEFFRKKCNSLYL